MDTTKKDLIIKLDYSKLEDIENLILLMEKANIKISKIGADEFSITIE